MPRAIVHIGFQKLLLKITKKQSLQKQPRRFGLNTMVQTKKNALISSLVVWVDSCNRQFLKWSLSRMKLKMIQQKVKCIPKGNFQQSSNSSYQSNRDHPISYISINDFKPILENYSSIKTLGPEDQKLYDSNYYSTFYSTTTQNGGSLQNRYQKVNIAIRKRGGVDDADKDTFLQNWMIRENPEFVLFQQSPKSNYCFKKIRSYNQQALDSVRKHSFEGFCQKNIKPQGFLMFKTSDRLKHQKQPLSDSLTFLNEIQTQKALQIFQHLLRAGGQIQSSQHYLFHIYRMMSILSSQSDDLFQQTYLQVIKQLQSRKLIYMKILCSMCVMVKPSARIYLPLLGYLMEEEGMMLNENNLTEEHYNYAFYHLIKNFDQPRVRLPSFYELGCFMHLKKIPILVAFPKQKVFYIQAYTRVQQLIQELISFYDLDPNVEYLLLINGCFLQSGILLDKLNLYENFPIERKWGEYEKFKSLKTLIVLKNMNEYKLSKRCFNIMYNYYVNQYLKGLFPLKEKEVLVVAALIMHSEISSEEEFFYDSKKYLSSRLRRKLSLAQDKNTYKNLVLKHYFQFHGTRLQARKQIVEILSKSKGFMTHFFKCSVFLDQLEQVDNWVGVKRNKLIFIDPENGRFIREICYSEISQWGSSKSQLCIKVDSVGRLHIECLQVEVMTSIFHGYLTYLYNQA